MPSKQAQTPRRRAVYPESDDTDLYLPQYLNTSVLKVVFFATLTAIIVAVPPLMSERLAAHWPWPRPGFVVIALAIIALASVVTLFHQQRFVISSHERYEESRTEVLTHAQRSVDRLYGILKVSQMVGDVDDLQSVFDNITMTCGNVFDCHMASLILYSKKTEELVVVSVGGKRARPEALGDCQQLGNGIAGWAAKNRQSLLLSRDCDPADYPDLELKSAIVTAAMVVPILTHDALVGVLNVSTRSRDVDYTEEDLKALEVFAETVGTRIRYSQQIHALTRRIRQLDDTLEKKADREPAC